MGIKLCSLSRGSPLENGVELKWSPPRDYCVFDGDQGRGLGAISFEDKIVGVMNFRQAKDLLSSAQVIVRKEAK